MLVLGSALLGCGATRAQIEPYYAEPLFPETQAGVERLDEYEALKDADQAPKLRAWMRYADQRIRANNALRDD